MARSVRRVLVTMAIAIPLSGCTTTQHAAQRERLDSARQRAALESTRVTVANPLVTPTAVTAIRSGRRTAVVVTVRNRGHRAVTDLPISIGYAGPDGSSVYLNSASGVNYFEAHLPAILPGHELTWVYTTGRSVPRGTRVFARVGLRPSAPAKLTELDVRIDLEYAQAPGDRSIAIRLQNPTGVPQYQLQVYAYAQQGGRYVAAGNETVAELGAGSKDRLRLPLVGRATDDLHVQAVPTILQ